MNLSDEEDAADQARDEVDFFDGLKVLLENGCDPDAKDTKGEYALIHAIKHHKNKSMQCLIDNGAKLDI